MTELIAEPAQPLERGTLPSLGNHWGGSDPDSSVLNVHTDDYARAPSQDMLDVVGRDNEDIKNSWIDMIRKVDELTEIRGNFADIFDRLGMVLADREQTRSALVERTTMLARAESAHQDLKAEFRTLYEEAENLRAENSLLRTENERFRALVRNRESRIEIIEAELLEQAESTASLRGNLDGKERAHAHLTSRAQALIRAMRDLKVQWEQAEQRAQLISERLMTETRRFEEQREGLEHSVRDLTEQLEKERLSKAITEGALEAARQNRLSPSQEPKQSETLVRSEATEKAGS